MVKAIVGANWGDEGKGKITDVLANDSDIVIRFQGGANAGHTIVNDYGKFALHQLPSGVFHQNITNIIGNGVAFSVENFVKEMAHLKDRGVPEPNIIISDRAQIVMPYHVAFDCYEEERLGKILSVQQRAVSLRSILTSIQKSVSRSMNFMMIPIHSERKSDMRLKSRMQL